MLIRCRGRLWIGHIVLMAIASSALVGCTASSLSSTDSGSGRVAGTLEAVGGPPPGTPRPLPGTVVLQETNGAAVRSVRVDSNGRFVVSVMPGSYKASGSSPQYEGGRSTCVAPRLIVKKAATTIVVIMCQEN